MRGVNWNILHDVYSDDERATIQRTKSWNITPCLRETDSDHLKPMTHWDFRVASLSFLNLSITSSCVNNRTGQCSQLYSLLLRKVCIQRKVKMLPNHSPTSACYMCSWEVWWWRPARADSEPEHCAALSPPVASSSAVSATNWVTALTLPPVFVFTTVYKSAELGASARGTRLHVSVCVRAPVCVCWYVPRLVWACINSTGGGGAEACRAADSTHSGLGERSSHRAMLFKTASNQNTAAPINFAFQAFQLP